jgi:hypothetical protein
MAEVDDLYNYFSGNSTKSPDKSGVDVESLYKQFSTPKTQAVEAAAVEPSFTNKAVGGFTQGVNDVLNTVGKGIGYVDRKLALGGEERAANFDKRVVKEQEDYKNTYPDSTTADIGRIGGQIAATAPLVPARIMQGANVVARALPTMLSSGEKIAAPLINRVGAMGLQGGIAGGEFNALTNSARPETSLPVDIGIGAATGVVAGPLTHGAVVGISKALSAMGNSWANLSVSRLANEVGMPPSAAKNIIGSLKDAGYTPEEAAIALRQMGSKATIADLDPSLSAEASGLASFGGKPTAILKGAFADRAATANVDAVKIFENKFGAKPDVYVERGKAKGTEADNITTEARTLTKADYSAAHTSPQKLDASGVLSHIDDNLETAVGDKAAVLEKIKGFFYKKDGSLKTSVKDLHEVREGIDDIINKTADKLPPKALASVENTRKLLDAEIKTNPQMLAADTKFSEKMKIKDGLVIGHDAIAKNVNKAEFIRTFDAATPEVQESIKKGILAAAGNLMEQSAQGQLSGAARLFGKKDTNREIFKHAFGPSAESVLDDLHKAITFRAVENEIRHGAQTAERQAYQRKYGERNDSSGFVTDAVKGFATDLATGSPGVASGVMALRNIGIGGKKRLMEIGSDNLAVSSADLFSRSGLMRDSALTALGKIEKVQSSKITTAKDITSKLPVLTGTPLTDYLREKSGKF